MYKEANGPKKLAAGWTSERRSLTHRLTIEVDRYLYVSRHAEISIQLNYIGKIPVLTSRGWHILRGAAVPCLCLVCADIKVWSIKVSAPVFAQSSPSLPAPRSRVNVRAAISGETASSEPIGALELRTPNPLIPSSYSTCLRAVGDGVGGEGGTCSAQRVPSSPFL